MINAIFSFSIVMLGIASGALAKHDYRVLLWLGGVPPILLAAAAYLIIPANVDGRQPVSPATGDTTKGKVPVLQLFSPHFRKRTLMLAALTGLNFFAYQTYSGWLTTFLTDVRHLSTAVIGGLVAWQFSGNIAGGFFWGWAGDRFGRRFNALGFMFAAIAIVVFLSLPLNILGLSLIGCIYGFMLSASVIWGPWITELYPPHLKSTAASIFNWGRIVSFFAPLITGAMAQHFGLGATMGLASVTFALAGALWLSLPETHERPLLPGRRLSHRREA
jgi:MFS family permease